ncbi:Exocyst complex component 7 [Halotydeus destructor]|nr:Exocyst complex component 7 [Halotydeus destructor]
MEDTRDRLEIEVKNLDKFKSILRESSSKTKSMCDILTHFDERLSKLEETIQPVYKETGNLQEKQENIVRTLEHLDYVIKFYTVASDVEPVIRSGPVAGHFQEYLDSLDRLQEAVHYFEESNPESPELMNVISLYNRGSDTIEKEFRQLLQRHSNPVAPVIINDLINEDDSLPDSDKNVLEHLSEKVKKELRILSEWLCANKSDDFITVYATIRSDVLYKSLTGLRDYQKAASGGSSSLAVSSSSGSHTSPMPTRRAVLQPIRESTPGRSKGTPKSIQNALKKLNIGDILGTSRGPAVPEFIENPSITEREIVSYLTSVTALSKLMHSELKLMEGIIPLPYQKKIFSRLVYKSLETIVGEGDGLANRVKRCVARHDFTSALSLFPILRHQSTMRHCFDLLFDGCSPEVLSKFQGLVVNLQTTIMKALEEFVDYIKSDNDTKVPRDGTVHELTNNVMIFIVQLLNYIDILSRVITVTDFHSLEGSTDKNRLAYAQYITRVLSGLGLTLQNKSENYSDLSLKAIFKLNNLHYILKTLRKSSLLGIVHLYNPNIEMIYEEQIVDNRRTYSQCWSKILHILLEMDKPYAQHRGSVDMGAKMKDKERQNIKDRFTNFNKEIEEIRRMQTQYAVPDSELRESLKKDNREFIVPKYEAFFERYVMSSFTKNPEKYLKYKPNDVARAIDTFFDSAAC